MTRGLFGLPRGGFSTCFHVQIPCIYQPSPKAYALSSFFYDPSAPSELLRVSPGRRLSTLGHYLTQVRSLLAASPEIVH